MAEDQFFILAIWIWMSLVLLGVGISIGLVTVFRGSAAAEREDRMKSGPHNYVITDLLRAILISLDAGGVDECRSAIREFLAEIGEQ